MSTEVQTVFDVTKSIVSSIAGYTAKFNHERDTSVVDLGSVGAHQGTKYRQLMVFVKAGYILIQLLEGFKSIYGGEEQKKILDSFTVLNTESESYNLIFNRFFDYNNDRNCSNGRTLLDTLKKTINV